MNPGYPLYVISKGRWESRPTVRALEEIHVPFRIVIEPQEYPQYSAVIDPQKILVLPFSNLGQGSIPARNWVWEHSMSEGAARHWILDDNIAKFRRLNRNHRPTVGSGTIFKVAEDWADRYENMALVGFQYTMFAPRKWPHPGILLNTRIYSCILIQNSLPYRWRGRYNEDTDLSLRAMKDGWCTGLFYSFLCDKLRTMMMKGGNTEDLYKVEDGRLKMAQSLMDQHPDVVTIYWRWGRWQHLVDYARFRDNKPIRKPGLVIPEGTNEYGMVLRVSEGAPPDESDEEDEDLSDEVRIRKSPKKPPARPRLKPGPPALAHAPESRDEPDIPSSQVSLESLDTLRRDRILPDWSPDVPPALVGVGEVGFDVETTGLRWWAGDRPLGLSVSWDGGRESRYLPWGHSGGNLDEDAVRRWVRDELRGKRLLGLNIRFDAHMMREWGVDLETLGCTLGDVGHYAALLDDHRRGFSLNAIAKDCLGDGKVEGLDVTRMKDYHASQVTEYARKDAALVLRIMEVQRPELEKQDLGRVMKLEDEVIFPVMAMEKNAAPIDVEKLHRWEKDSARELDLILMRLHRAAGFRVNPDSPKDLDRLFRERGVSTDSKTEKGRASFTDAVMAQAAEHDPVIALVRDAGHLSDLRVKYLVPYSRSVGSDGLLRFALHQLRGDEYGAVSGRFSSSQPVRGEGANIQQVMAVDKQIRLHGDRYIIRELFVPGSGALLASDAKQIEYRIFAHYANAPALIRAYQEDPDTDFHAIVGEMIAKYRTGLDRTRIKGCNFGKLYGAGAAKLGGLLGIPEDQARELIRTYDLAFPDAARMLRSASEIAEQRGYVKTLLGRRARFREGDRFYSALNRVIQGTAADIMKRKLVELHDLRKTLGFLLRITVHDEVIGDVPDIEAARRVATLLDDQTTEMRVPILWDTKTGMNWRDAK